MSRAHLLLIVNLCPLRHILAIIFWCVHLFRSATTLFLFDQVQAFFLFGSQLFPPRFPDPLLSDKTNHFDKRI